MDGDGVIRFSDAGLVKSAGGIRIEYQRLARYEGVWNADAVFAAPRARTLSVLMGSGRGCALHGSSLPPMALLPLRGHVRISDGERARTLQSNDLFVNEAGQFLHALGSSEALWVAFVAPPDVWQALFDLPSENVIPAPVLMPGTHRTDRATHPMPRARCPRRCISARVCWICSPVTTSSSSDARAVRSRSGVACSCACSAHASTWNPATTLAWIFRRWRARRPPHRILPA